MRTQTFGRIPFNTDNRPLPLVPRSDVPEPPSIEPPTGKPRPTEQPRALSWRRGAGPAFLQRLRIKRLR